MHLNEEFIKREGTYSFEYEIRGQKHGIFTDKLAIKVVPIKEVFELMPSKISLGDNFANITIKNNVNSNLENVKIEFNSAFFNVKKNVSFKLFESVSIPIELDKSKISKLTAGPYILNANVLLGSASVKYEGIIDYAEKEKVITEKESLGFLIRETKVTKINEGNKEAMVSIEISRDIISRLFTTFSANPLEVKRGGLVVDYVWKQEIKPSESFSVGVTTNYTFIVILIVLIVVIALLVRAYTLTSIRLHKRVSFVRTKGGEFALKIQLRVKARKAVDGVQVIDRMPGMSKLYDKLGRRPDKIDEATRRLFWNINHLNKGEERVFSYIVYSKLKVMGRFELPTAMAIFTKDGKRQEVTSNRAFFVSETMSGEAE